MAGVAVLANNPWLLNAWSELEYTSLKEES